MPRPDTPVNRMPAPPALEPGYYILCGYCNGYGLLAGEGEVRPCYDCHTAGVVRLEDDEHECDRSLVEWGEAE